MKEFKGTKQKWFFLEDAKGYSVFAERTFICQTNNKPSRSEARDNVRLIATAPKLLEELQRVIKLAESLLSHIHNQSTYPENNKVIMFDVDAIQYAKSVIAKALGE